MPRKPGAVEYDRLRSLLIQDKVSTPTQYADLIRSDVYTMLCNYMELYSDDIDVRIDCDDRGFRITVEAYTARFKQIGMNK